MPNHRRPDKNSPEAFLLALALASAVGALLLTGGSLVLMLIVR